MEHPEIAQAWKRIQDYRKQRPVTEDRIGDESLQVPDGFYSYVFELQAIREKTGRMDYNEYAGKMWEAIARESSDGHPEIFENFRNDLRANLGSINMGAGEYRYADVGMMLDIFLRHYGSSVQSVNLWSTGDVKGTGYQVEKIIRSGIVNDFRKAVKRIYGEGAKKFLDTKTAFLVADNKFDELADFVRSAAEKGETNIRVAIIEDSSKNFDKANQCLDVVRTEYPGVSITITPVWATYSREGIAARKKAAQEGTEEALREREAQLNAIESFRELADVERFGNIFRNAHVFVDFDGVIGNNVEMREAQSAAIYRSLLNGVMSLGKSREEAEQIIAERTPDAREALRA